MSKSCVKNVGLIGKDLLISRWGMLMGCGLLVGFCWALRESGGCAHNLYGKYTGVCTCFWGGCSLLIGGFALFTHRTTNTTIIYNLIKEKIWK